MKKTHKNSAREQAENLRRIGMSYGKISKKTKIPKSTLSMWLKNVPLSPEDKQRLYTPSVQMITFGKYCQRQRREKEVSLIVRKAELEIKKPIVEDVYRLFGSALYWAEGSKTKMFQMTNSDPYLILFWVKWVEKIFRVPPHKLTARLNIYPQQSEKQIKKFWSDLTGIPVKKFGKSYIKPLSKNYKKNNLYYGTMRVEVPKGTDYRHRVYGWTQAVLKDIAPQINLTEKRWSKLKDVAKPTNLH
ncbi:MAG: hypothetical protein V1896_00465 [Candidatus Zambryskibacteria bacterium]